MVLDPPADSGFVVDDSTCVGQLPGSARCAVTISFAPLVTGETTANLNVTFANASTAALALRGVGAPPPTMTVLPDVAADGQVVAVVGSGFPAGAVVDFSWDRGRVVRTITIDDIGGFAETLVVLPNTEGSTIEMVVAGQVDLFADVTATMLISGSAGRSDTAVFGGQGRRGLGGYAR
ncbi:MAG: hypothetical protein HKN44_13225 [Ilumatobacter sp.]|nr:hypothetical protein [Ilumatobacter sp.]